MRALNSSTLTEEQKNAKRIELGKQYQIQLDAINANRDEVEQKKIDDAVIKENERIAKNGEQRKKDYEKKQKDDAEATAKEKKLSEERIATAEAERDAKTKAFESIGNSLNQLSELVGKNTEAGKGFAIASLIIEQAVAVSKIIANTKVANAKSAALFPTTLGQPYVAINTISAGLGIASAIASVVKGIRTIRGVNTKTGSGSTGGAPSLSAGGGGTVAPPLPPQLATQTINAGQVNQLASATARAYVVESDVSGNQERINRLNRASRIN
jgi:superfamily II DNA/RNA helicase